jgi:hypothetical protein
MAWSRVVENAVNCLAMSPFLVAGPTGQRLCGDRQPEVAGWPNQSAKAPRHSPGLEGVISESENARPARSPQDAPDHPTRRAELQTLGLSRFPVSDGVVNAWLREPAPTALRCFEHHKRGTERFYV